MTKTILIIGTFDTKDDELRYMQSVIHAQGGATLTMDVSVLRDPAEPTDISKHEVAQAGGHTIAQIIDMGDENSAMQAMAAGASHLACAAALDRRADGVIILGGTMGTDLALDVCMALPLGFPKYIVSTVAFSALLPPERIAADVQMILWAGGLYGLNSICKSSLSQAAGAVLGAARAVDRPDAETPLIGMTSFGKTVLRYMEILKPALEERGFEVAVFHATGMGGRAFESLAAEGRFACALDLAPQEVVNHAFGSDVTAGPDRMMAAGRAGIPQIIAPGCHDLVDFVGWREPKPQWQAYEIHAHNRLISSIVLNVEDRAVVAEAFARCLAEARGKCAFVMPTGGCHEWDRPGAPFHNLEGVAAFASALKARLPDGVDWVELPAHINDAAFAEAVLTIFDRWLAAGVITAPT